MHIFTRVNSGQCYPFLRLLCGRAEIQTSKMELLEKIRDLKTQTIFAITSIFDVWLGLDILLKSICSGNTQKSNLRKFFLQSCKQLNSKFHETGLYQRENLRENIIAKSSSYSYWKGKTFMEVFINLQLTENWRLCWPFPGNFYKISAINHCDCRQNRLEQKLTSVTVFKLCIIN